jgi:hypothetical protein
MGELKFEFKDAIKISKPTSEDLSVWKDSLGETYTGTRKALRVVLEATHSALINRNVRWYVPSRMKDGADSFINANKPAKVLKHHDVMSDPIGVVRSSRFVPTIPQELIDNPDVQVLMSSTSEMKDQIQAMKRLIKSGITNSKDWKGLGYIELVADILDPDTINQISDGRFDAVSTSFRSPEGACCFICGKNWADGLCDHTDIGESYEDENEEKWPMMLVPSSHKYDEVSLVVMDADPITAIHVFDNVENNDINKTINYDDAWKSNIPTSNFVYEFKDCEEDNNMAKKSQKEDPVKDMPALSDKAKVVFDFIKTVRPELNEDKLVEYANSISDLQLENGKYPNQEDAEIDDNTAILYALEDLETKSEEINADVIYAEFEKEFDLMKEEGLLTEDSLADAKLSSEKRSKLSKSTFCGPNRSFPVPDCAHVTAAKRLIGRYKGPGSKSSILACVNRKAKALGCGTSSDSTNKVEPDVIKFDMPTCECMSKATDAEARALFAKAEAELIARNLTVVRECSKCADFEAELTKNKTEVEDLKKKLHDANNTLSVLREELRFQQSDYLYQVDKYIDLDTKYRAYKEEKLAIIGTLVGKYKSIDIAKESLKDADINTIEAPIMDALEMDKILEKLHNGMAHEPKTGDLLKSPAICTDGDNKQFAWLTETAEAAIKSINKLITDKNFAGARRLFNNMKTKKVFPADITFETISAAKNDPAE